MLWLKRALLVLILLLVALASVIFTLENQALVQLSFVGNQSPQWPLAAYMVFAFIAGGVLGLLAGQVLRLRLRLKMAKTASQLKRSQRQLSESANVSSVG